MKSSAVGASKTVIENGRMILGIWQDIYFCEFDYSSQPAFYVKIIKGDPAPEVSFGK